MGIQTGQGSSPEWNETFVFSVSGEVEELVIKIKDSDVGSEDDLVGEAKYIQFLQKSYDLANKNRVD